jgi:YHS domain-containing protein
MKKILAIALISASSYSCGNSEATSTHEMSSTKKASTDPNAVLDPVCKMVKTDEWTETAESHGETYYFCSPVCKESFEKDPHKYLPDHQH